MPFLYEIVAKVRVRKGFLVGVGHDTKQRIGELELGKGEEYQLWGYVISLLVVTCPDHER